MNSIVLESVNKHYKNQKGETLHVLQNFSLEVHQGSIHAIFGPNGSGKSTLLRVVSGYDAADRGVVALRGSLKNTRPGFVFQNYRDTLLPWETVEDNLRLFAQVVCKDKNQCAVRQKEAMDRFGLIEHKDKYVYQLSGGLAQSLALSREMMYQSKLLLLDEPFSALDFSNSRIHWMEFLASWRERATTTLLVSHDIDEAIFLSDRITVLSKYPTDVVGTIENSLPRPRNLELFKSSEFFEVKKKVIELFEQGYE